jgi:hypothetical protein
MKRIGFGVAVAVVVGTLVGAAATYAVWQVESLRALMASTPLFQRASGRAIGVQEEPAAPDEATCAAPPAAGDASEQSEPGPTPTLAPGIPPDLRSHGAMIYVEVEATGDGLQVGVVDGER